MPINWGLMDTQYPQKLSSLFDPAAIQQRQTAVSDQQTMGQLRQAQLMGAAQGLQRQPELARREDLAYQQQQEGMQAQQANAMRKQKLIEQLNAPNVPPQIKQQIFTQLYPEEAAKQAFKEEPTKPAYLESQGGFVEPPSRDYPQGRIIPVPGVKEKSVSPTSWQVVQTDKGFVQVNPTTGQTRPLGVQPIKKSSQVALSPTAQKELFEAEDVAQSSRNVINLLDEAVKLNDKAYSGVGAKARAVIRSNVPGESEAANATIALDNLMTGQALESLKATFGGMPTEGERKILLDIQASAEKTPSQRADIMNRAKRAAENRMKYSQEKARKLRSGEYFNPEDQISPDTSIMQTEPVEVTHPQYPGFSIAR